MSARRLGWGLAALAVSGCAHGGGLRFGRPTSGELLPEDRQFADGSHYRIYPFVGRAGDTVTAILSSDDFDAYVIITDDHGNTVARDDDGGGECNARLTYTLPRAGSYREYAGSSAKAEIGAFQLTLSRGAPPPRVSSDTSCSGFGRVAGVIHVGQTITDTLTSADPMFDSDSTYFQRWVLPVQAGRPITIDLSSRVFDAYLILTRGRREKIAENDDGGGDCNARIVYTPRDNRPLRVIANTASHPNLQVGPYTLRVADGASVVDTAHDCQPPAP